MNNKRAFSLIELMVVLTIIALIAAVALPNYKDYVNRAKVVSALALVEPCLSQVYQYFFKNGSLPDGASTDQVVSCQGVSLTSTSAILKGKVSTSFAYRAGSTGVPGYFQINLTHTDLHAVGNSNQYQFYVKLTDNNGDLEYSCGSSGATNPLPDSLKPSTCT